MNTIVLIEFRDGKPHTVWTKSNHTYWSWDFNWSRAYDSFLCFQTGGGLPHLSSPDAAYWAPVGAIVLADVGYQPEFKRQLYVEAPDSNRIDYDHSRLFIDATECGSVYCVECHDFLPTDQGDTPCPHVRWSGKCGTWTSPQEPCRCGSPKQRRSSNANAGSRR